MKKALRTGVASLVVLLATAAGRAAAPDLAAWTHVVPVELAEQPAKGLVEVELTPEVIAGVRPDLADLRVMTKAGEAVPYVGNVYAGDAKYSSPIAALLTNPVYLPGKQSSVTADFGARATRSRIDVYTPGTNFRRRVSVEASQDGTAWEVLKQTDWLFRVNYEGGTFEKSQVLLPDNDFRFLRVTVFNAPDDPEQVAIRSLVAWRLTETPSRITDAPAKVITGDNKTLRATEIEADLGCENLPLYDVRLAFDDPVFLRRVEVFGRNLRTRTIIEPVENAQPRTWEVEEPWTSLGGGSIYRLPAGQGQEAVSGLSLGIMWEHQMPGVEPPARILGQYRYLLVRVFNADDQPLKFAGMNVRRLREFVSFRAEPAGPYQIYFGNAEAARPNYDLESFAERLRAEGVTVAKLGTVGVNPLFAATVKVVPWSERHAVLLWSTLVVVLAVLTGLVLRQARSLGATRPGKEA